VLKYLLKFDWFLPGRSGVLGEPSKIESSDLDGKGRCEIYVFQFRTWKCIESLKINFLMAVRN
jgi:hypothetical protein